MDDAFLQCIQIRRHTEEELEHLERNLKLAKPNITSGTVVGAAIGGASVGAAIAAPGIDALIASYLGAEEEKKFRLSEVQEAIEKDLKACIRFQELFDSLNRPFSPTPGFLEHIPSRFADLSVLPRDITQLVKSSLDRHRGSTSPIVAEIRGILDNLKCPDEAEIKRLVSKDEKLDW